MTDNVAPTRREAGPKQRPGRPTGVRRALRIVTANQLLLVGTIFTLFMLLLAAVGPIFAPYDPTDINNLNRLQAPSAEHWLGTDEFGRDVFSRLLYGARLSAVIGGVTLLATTVLGTIVGLLAGFYRRVDGILMRIMDALMTFPSLVLAIALISVMGITSFNVVIALTLVFTPQTARVVRASVLSIRETEYVEGALALGARDPRVLLRHVLPNCVSPLIVQSTFVMAYTILSEAALSYIGAGVPPPAPSWGNMLADSRLYMFQAPWLTYFPGIAISIFVLGLILMGDGLRDYLDPRNV
ncbi:MAG: ABC transporter permease [Trueperaceae bacterium]